MNKANVKLSGPVEFSVGSGRHGGHQGQRRRPAAVRAFLKADTSTPGLREAHRHQAQDALKLSATIQQRSDLAGRALRRQGRRDVAVHLADAAANTNPTAAVVHAGCGSSSLSIRGRLRPKREGVGNRGSGQRGSDEDFFAGQWSLVHRPSPLVTTENCFQRRGRLIAKLGALKVTMAVCWQLDRTCAKLQRSFQSVRAVSAVAELRRRGSLIADSTRCAKTSPTTLHNIPRQ